MIFRSIVVLLIGLSVSICDARVTFTLNSDSRPSIQLSQDGSTVFGGGNREKQVTVSISKGVFSKDPIPAGEKLRALKAKVAFYQLFQKYGVDLNQAVTLIYKEKPLQDALAELIPSVPVVFDNVDENITIKDLMASDAPLEKVIEHLDISSSVYFVFTDSQLIIKKET